MCKLIPPVGAIVFVLGILILFMGALSYAAGRYHLHPEWIRKILHLGMGGVSLCFPWLFKETWPVLVLAVLAIIWLWGARRIAWLHNIFGAVLSNVRRQSWGEIYFAFSVALLFWVSRGETILFIVPIATLTFADAGAALVGVRWGKHRFLKRDKTVEGSLAFFCIAFCIIKLVITLGSSYLTLLAVAVVAIVATIVEALSGDGVDNLSVPLATFVMLEIWI